MKYLFILLFIFISSSISYANSNTELTTGIELFHDKKYKEAYKYLQKEAVQNNSDAQYCLGLMYRYGNGVPMNCKKAFKFFYKAAEQNNIYAQIRLGKMYRWGTGVKSDYKKSIYWYFKASEQNNPDAQRVLCSIYYIAKVTFMNNAESLNDIARSAENGNPKAQYKLGLHYYYKSSISEHDKEKAFYWLKKAALEDNAGAQFFLSQMYSYGIGTEENIKESDHWVSKAYHNGCQNDKAFWSKYQP